MPNPVVYVFSKLLALVLGVRQADASLPSTVSL